MKKLYVNLGVLFLGLCLFFWQKPGMAEQQEAEGKKPVTLILQWVPQAQFAGYYVALEKGLYREKGLDVRIIRGGADRDGVDYVQRGEADFAVLFLSGALAARDQGVPLVNVAQIVNQSNLMLIGWKDQGIESVQQLHEKKISLWGGVFQADFQSFFAARGLRPQFLPQYYSVNLFINKGVAACSAMHYNEYHVLYQAGIDVQQLSAFYMKDYGCGFPEDGLYCLESTWQAHPQESRAFAEASLAGWQYAAEHEEEALDIVMKHVQEANLPTNRAHMRWMLKTILATIIPEGASSSWKLGVLAKTDYQRTVEALQWHGLLRTNPSYENFYRGIGNDVQ